MAQVMVEIHVPPGNAGQDYSALTTILSGLGLQLLPDFEPVPMYDDNPASDAGPSSLIVTGEVKDAQIMDALERHPMVIRVWSDTPIAPFRP